MQEVEVRDRIRMMIRTGELPCEEPQRTWGGRGEGKRCAACVESIQPTEIEFEVALGLSGATVRLHRLCHAIWLEECESSVPPV